MYLLFRSLKPDGMGTPGSREVAMHVEAGQRMHIHVGGVVQGVGFRPFICRLAENLGLAGWVRNTNCGVDIEVEGPPGSVSRFLLALREERPPMAEVESIEAAPRAAAGESGFRVLESGGGAGDRALISPDIATCPDCLREMLDKKDRRYRYPFVNCTNCGPRFTIVESVPYDRQRTAMRSFELCSGCRREYGDTADRRFHAEPVACPECGPQTELLELSGNLLARGGNAIGMARTALAAGKIIAIKGLGGFHLACDATDDAAVSGLRARKKRPHRPMAVMCRDLAIARRLCSMNESEERELCGPRRPILLLPRKPAAGPDHVRLSGLVAPGHGDLGVMLPYTPLHELLLEDGGPACVVMTSANRAGEPLIADEREALQELGGIADAVLTHDREILNRCDDSLGYFEEGRLVLVRRSRGFCPLPLNLERPVKPTLALGAMTNNVFALAAGRQLFLSQHIGDVDGVESLTFLRQAIARFRAWLGIDPEIIAHDMHPDLMTTRLARELAGGRRLAAVQHHHAHLASAMAAAAISERVQGLVFDGTGWAPDGTVWGGELLVGSADGFERAGHLAPLPLPGGESAIRRPLRLAVAYLHAVAPETAGLPLALWKRADPGEIAVVRRMVDRRVNTPDTSSVGRLFDAAAALLGIRDDVSYEGQAAMELEQLARRAGPHGARKLTMPVEMRAGRVVLNPGPVLVGLAAAALHGEDRAGMAFSFHQALANAAATACARVREMGGPGTVVLCGGVFHNRLLRALLKEALEKVGLRAVLPYSVPAGDGGLALGQVLVANPSGGVVGD